MLPVLLKQLCLPGLESHLTFRNHNFLDFIPISQRGDYIYTTAHLAKDSMLAIEMGLGSVTDKELGAIGIWPGIGHTQTAGFMFVRVISRFIFKSVARAARTGFERASPAPTPHRPAAPRCRW